MVKHRLRLVFLPALLWIFALHAKDLATYRMGDTAGADITTPVALDVIDAEATASRKTAEALKTPAIFREFSANMTNALIKEFSAAFIGERAAFLSAFDETFAQSTNKDDMVATPDFGKFVAAFNQKKNSFPVTAELAALWARGNDGLAVQNKFLDSLLQMTHRAIRPDNLPSGCALGETLRLVTVNDANEKTTLVNAEQNGKLITQANLTTLTRLRTLFRHSFPDDQQNLARALQVFLKPNCVADVELTQQARDRDVRQLVVVNHYEVGQTIVRRGETIGMKTLAALDQLRDKTLPDQLNQQIAAEQDRTRHEQAQAQQEHDRAQQALAQAQQVLDRARQEHEEALNLNSRALETNARNVWLIVAAVGVGTIFLLAALLAWRSGRSSTSLVPARAENLPPSQAALQAQLAPHLAQVLKESLVQGLASQRSELLEAQQKAAAEITELVRRLDALQAPMYVRLLTYEKRIEELVNDLSVRDTENRELLKLKIEMTRQQLELERARNPVESSWSTLA